MSFLYIIPTVNGCVHSTERSLGSPVQKDYQEDQDLSLQDDKDMRLILDISTLMTDITTTPTINKECPLLARSNIDDITHGIKPSERLGRVLKGRGLFTTGPPVYVNFDGPHNLVTTRVPNP